MSNTKHYCFGSGMFGCLYDYGPHFVSDKHDAIESLTRLFSEQLEEGEEARMGYNLRTEGRHVFENPREAGAEYCDISERSGACPIPDDYGGYIDPDELEDCD